MGYQEIAASDIVYCMTAILGNTKKGTSDNTLTIDKEYLT